MNCCFLSVFSSVNLFFVQMKEEDNAPQRMGSVAFSRFGSCVAAIGDLDGDGYEGAVYFLKHTVSVFVIAGRRVQ